MLSYEERLFLIIIDIAIMIIQSLGSFLFPFLVNQHMCFYHYLKLSKDREFSANSRKLGQLIYAVIWQKND